MQDFTYVVWFRDLDAWPSDEDYEWPAVYVVTAETAVDAQAWGDRIAHDRVARKPREIFLWSSIEPHDGGDASPRVRIGETPDDDFIGW